MVALAAREAKGAMPGEAVSINVYARVRGSSDEVVTPADKPGALICRNLEFSLDSAFNSEASQKDCFDSVEASSQAVARVLQGFNSTVLAYGQTGSGKTFTMMGPEEADFGNPDAPELGLVPRACGQIFSNLPAGFSVKVSYLEIYNDRVNDLLGQKEDLTLRAQGVGVVPDGLQLRQVSSVKDVMAAIKLGDGRRVIAAMAMNPRSSRGHGVVAIHLLDAKGNAYGRLTLADLAGMESSKKSSAVPDSSGKGADPIRKEEAKRINTSLLALSSVISVLASKGTARVPYRDSKLTRLLQDSLGGNCKCCILVTIRCEKENLDEAINTLRFAQRAKNVTVNLVSNANARDDAKPKSAKLAEELSMATAALGDFETKLAASENHKETLLAQVNNLKEEMEVLQREGAKKPRASLTGGGGSGRLGSGRFSSTMQAHVQMLEAKVEALEEENRTLRQRELMRKMFALGDQAMADEASGGSGEAASTPAPAAQPQELNAPPKIEFTLLRGFTARELVTFDPFRGFDIAQADGFDNIEEAATAKPGKRRGEQQVESLTRQSTLSRISSFMGSFRSKQQQVTPS